MLMSAQWCQTHTSRPTTPQHVTAGFNWVSFQDKHSSPFKPTGAIYRRSSQKPLHSEGSCMSSSLLGAQRAYSGSFKENEAKQNKESFRVCNSRWFWGANLFWHLCFTCSFSFFFFLYFLVVFVKGLLKIQTIMWWSGLKKQLVNLFPNFFFSNV